MESSVFDVIYETPNPALLPDVATLATPPLAPSLASDASGCDPDLDKVGNDTTD